jgi:hypothetical protein
MTTMLAEDPDFNWAHAQINYRRDYTARISRVASVLRSPMLKTFGTIGGAKLGSK